MDEDKLAEELLRVAKELTAKPNIYVIWLADEEQDGIALAEEFGLKIQSREVKGNINPAKIEDLIDYVRDNVKKPRPIKLYL